MARPRNIPPSPLHNGRSNINLEECPAERGRFPWRSRLVKLPLLRRRRLYECQPRLAGDNGKEAQLPIRHHPCVTLTLNPASLTYSYATVVLTTIWCELVADPHLYERRWVRSRDHKLLGAFFIFFGGFVGRALVDDIGAAGALGIGTGIRVLITLGWLFVPSSDSELVSGEKR